MVSIIEDPKEKINPVVSFGIERCSRLWRNAKIYYGVKLVGDWLKKNEKELVIALIIILASTFAYGLGRLSKIKELREPITITNAKPADSADSSSDASLPQRGITASKKGTKYYLPNCYNNTIKPENIITFKTEAEAQQAGYSIAATCKN